MSAEPNYLEVLSRAPVGFVRADELIEAHAAVAQLVKAARQMMRQDQVRSATYNAAPHMATAADDLSAALAKFGGA